MNDSPAKPVFALPVVMTFHDCINEAYTAEIYVRKATPHSDVQPLVEAIADLSICVLKQYRFDGKTYTIDGAEEALKAISPYAMGTMKWRISYYARRTYQKDLVSRAFTIPGWQAETCLPHTDLTDMQHPKWLRLMPLIRALVVSSEGYEPEAGSLTVEKQTGNWPPKRAKQRLKEARKSL